MPLTTRIAAYEDCIKFYEEALADRVGARVKFEDRTAAYYFSIRMQQARSLLRAESRLTYSETDQRFDKCEFDCLSIRVKFVEDIYWVYAERVNVDLRVEPLTTMENDK